MKPIHRDDIDSDAMAAIEAHFAEMFPGMKVVCAGDMQGETPDGLRSAMESVERAHAESLALGKCIDCDAVMPGYDGFSAEDWKPAEGWTWFVDQDGCIQAWQCPSCDQKDRAEEVAS